MGVDLSGGDVNCFKKSPGPTELFRIEIKVLLLKVFSNFFKLLTLCLFESRYIFRLATDCTSVRRRILYWG